MLQRPLTSLTSVLFPYYSAGSIPFLNWRHVSRLYRNNLRKLQENEMAEKSERTFIMVKPDGVQRGLVGEIIRRFEQKGYKLVALKFMQV